MTAEWEAAVRRAQVPVREDIQDIEAEVSPGPEPEVADAAAAAEGRVEPADVEPVDAEPVEVGGPGREPSSATDDAGGVPATSGGLRESDIRHVTERTGEDPSAGEQQDAERPDSDGAEPHPVATPEAVLDTDLGEPPGEPSTPVPDEAGAGTPSAPDAPDVEPVLDRTEDRIVVDVAHDVDAETGLGRRPGDEPEDADDVIGAHRERDDPSEGLESGSPTEAEVASARSAVSRAVWAEMGTELTRSPPDSVVQDRLGRLFTEAHRRDVFLADVTVRTGWSERLRVHDYQRRDPPPPLVERGANKVWATGDDRNVRVVFSPSLEQSQHAAGLNPVADPHLVTVRDREGRVVWSQPMATVSVARNEPGQPRLRTDVEQVSEVGTRTFRAIGGMASGGVSELPGVGEAVSAVLDRVGTDRGKLDEDRKTDVPFPAERFTRDGYRLSIEIPAHAEAYARDATLVRDLHTRTIDRLADGGVLTRPDADWLSTELERLPWDKVGTDTTTADDRTDCLRLLGEDGLRQWIDQRLRTGMEST